jgi:hypothetical protein
VISSIKRTNINYFEVPDVQGLPFRTDIVAKRRPFDLTSAGMGRKELQNVIVIAKY